MPRTAATAAVDQDRADWCSIRVADRKLFESVIADEFFASLASIGRLRIRADCARIEKRLLHILPATRFCMRAGAFLRDGRRATQTRIEPRVDFGGRMTDLETVATDDRRADHLSGRRMTVVELRFGSDETFSLNARNRESDDAEAEKRERN